MKKFGKCGCCGCANRGVRRDLRVPECLSCDHNSILLDEADYALSAAINMPVTWRECELYQLIQFVLEPGVTPDTEKCALWSHSYWELLVSCSVTQYFCKLLQLVRHVFIYYSDSEISDRYSPFPHN